MPAAEAERILSGLAGSEMSLPAGAVTITAPETYPACGGSSVMWGCDNAQTRDRHEIHSLVWHDTEWMADTFICRDCHAGWLEPDGAEPTTWVRPYWIAHDK